MSHYATLGIHSDASPEEVKTAFRRRARESHPDREGGDPELMAEVNRAYAVLSDPARRAEYDRTGSSVLPDSVEVEARNFLLQTFKSFLDNEDVLGATGRLFAENQSQLVKSQFETKNRVARLQKKSGRVKSKTGENLFQLLLDEQIRNLDEALSKIERAIQVVGKCQEMLKDYEQEPTQQHGSFNQLMSAQQSAWHSRFPNQK